MSTANQSLFPNGEDHSAAPQKTLPAAVLEAVDAIIADAKRIQKLGSTPHLGKLIKKHIGVNVSESRYEHIRDLVEKSGIKLVRKKFNPGGKAKTPTLYRRGKAVPERLMSSIIADARSTNANGGVVGMRRLLIKHFGYRVSDGFEKRLRDVLVENGIIVAPARGPKHLPEKSTRSAKTQQPGEQSASESIPGPLGGIAADDSDVIDVSFTLGDDLTADMDEFLAEEVRNGNRRALRLLKSQIRRG